MAVKPNCPSAPGSVGHAHWAETQEGSSNLGENPSEQQWGGLRDKQTGCCTPGSHPDPATRLLFLLWGCGDPPPDLAQPSPHHALLNQRLPERISADPSAGISLPPEQGEVTTLRGQPTAFPAACRARNPPSQTAPRGHEDHGSSRCRTSQEMLSRKHQAQPEQTDPSLL